MTESILDIARRVRELSEAPWVMTGDALPLAVAVERMAAALRGTIGVATWMSGSADFAPKGIAGEGWPSQREILYAAMDTLRELGIPLREDAGDE